MRRACSLDEVEPGEVKAIKCGHTTVAVVRRPDGEVFAVNDTCPHHGASLARGKLLAKVEADGRAYSLSQDEFVLRCPWHSYEFELDSGRCVVDGERRRVRRYAVEIRGTDIFVDTQTTIGD